MQTAVGVVVTIGKVNAIFLSDLLVIAICQEFLVAQALEGVFQLLLRFRQGAGGIEGFSLFIQNFKSEALFLHPGMIAHFSKQLRFFLGHFPVFPAGPVFRQHQGLIEKGVVLLLLGQLLIAPASQKVFVGQQCQAQPAPHRGNQPGGAEHDGNEF